MYSSSGTILPVSACTRPRLRKLWRRGPNSQAAWKVINIHTLKIWRSAHWSAAADERWRAFDRFYEWTSPLPNLYYHAARSNA